jgi:hypothetical protein
MHCAPLWNVDSTKILTSRKLAAVKGQVNRQANVRRNLVIFRLACC